MGISNTKKIFLTGDKFNSDDAINMGIANFVSKNTEIISDAMEFCKKISKILDLPFFDSDKEIEKKYKASISNIFFKLGEETFREY